MIRALVTFGYVGRLRPAPGTWASVAAVALAVLAYELALPHRASLGGLFPALFIAATLLVAGLGFWAVPQAIAGQADKDPSEIVIDEVAGQWLAMCFTLISLWGHGVELLPTLTWGTSLVVPQLDFAGTAWPGYVVPFVLFRLFDIWKPWLVGRADRRGDGAGVMLDDLWAGLFAGIGSLVLAGLYHAVLQPWLGL